MFERDELFVNEKLVTTNLILLQLFQKARPFYQSRLKISTALAYLGPEYDT